MILLLKRNDKALALQKMAAWEHSICRPVD